MNRILLILFFVACTNIFSTCTDTTVKQPKMDYLNPSGTVIEVVQNYDYSAHFLHKWVNKVSNTDRAFSLLREITELRDTVGKIVISIGNTKSNQSVDAPQCNSCYVIKRSGNLISIKGADTYGNYAGVNYFLDHYCGVRFYLPTDLFTSQQSSDSIFIPDSINVIGKPDIDNVFMTGYYFSGNSDISQWQTYWAWINGLNRNFIPEHQHTFSSRFFDSTVFVDYPRIFSNGYFPISKLDQQFTPDFFEPSLVDAAEYASIKYFNSNPNSQSIAFSVMDGSFKIGPATKLFASIFTDVLQGYANANATFLNNLAARLRADGLGDKTIVYLVYSGVRYVPTIHLDSMILPVLVTHVAELRDSDLLANNPTVMAWDEVTNRLGEHDWAEGMGYLYPRIYSQNVSKFCKRIKSLGKLDFYDIEAYPNFGLDGPELYEMSKIFWNVNVNADSVRSLFCRDMFGNSAMEMKMYFDELEGLNSGVISQSHMYNYKEQLAASDSFHIMSLRNHINNALLLDTNYLVQQRINFFNDGFKIYEGAWRVYNGDDTTKYSEFLRSIAGHGDLYYLAGDSTTFSKNIPTFIKSIKK